MEHLLFTIICGLLCILSEGLPTRWQGIDPVRIFIIVLLDPLNGNALQQDKVSKRRATSILFCHGVKKMKNAKHRLNDEMGACGTFWMNWQDCTAVPIKARYPLTREEPFPTWNAMERHRDLSDVQKNSTHLRLTNQPRRACQGQDTRLFGVGSFTLSVTLLWRSLCID